MPSQPDAPRGISLADLRGALPPVKGEHFAAITEPKQVGALLRAMDGYTGSRLCGAHCALHRWYSCALASFAKPNGRISTLMGRNGVIPSPRRIRPILFRFHGKPWKLLKELQALTGAGRFVFPGARTNGRPMSDNAILAAMRRMGIDKEEMSGHGFRAMARTILDEVLGFRPDFIEHQLAHAVKDPNGRAYNRTAHLPNAAR